MHHRALVLVGCLVTLFGAGCASSSREVEQKNLHIRELEDQVAELQGDNGRLKAELYALRSKPQTSGEQAIPDDFKGLDARWRNGELVVAIEDDVLFQVGQAKLTAAATKTLDQVGRAIQNKYAGQYVRVEGHTDNQPIRRTKNLWLDNWDLGANRARTVLVHLVDKKFVSPEEISLASFGEFRPRESNATKAGQAKNRRVEIVILPKKGN